MLPLMKSFSVSVSDDQKFRKFFAAVIIVSLDFWIWSVFSTFGSIGLPALIIAPILMMVTPSEYIEMRPLYRSSMRRFQDTSFGCTLSAR